MPKRVQGKWDISLGVWTVDALRQQTSLAARWCLGDCAQPCTLNDWNILSGFDCKSQIWINGN